MGNSDMLRADWSNSRVIKPEGGGLVWRRTPHAVRLNKTPEPACRNGLAGQNHLNAPLKKTLYASNTIYN